MRYYSFNTFLREKFGERVQKITLDAGLTCPNRDGSKGTGGCIYCNAKGSGTGAWQSCPDLKHQALSSIEFLSRRFNAKKFIAYFQSFCNTYAPVDRLKTLYEQVLDIPGVVGLAVATRPDCLSPQALELLSSYSKDFMVWVELGLQSSNDRTLELINRGHSFNDFLTGFALCRQHALLTCIHIIIGLPGETENEVHRTATDIAGIKPDALKIHSLYVSKETALEQRLNEGRYTPLDQNDYVNLACDVLELIPESIVIQRLTGDPDPSALVSPQWSLKKQQTLNLIEAELKRRGTRQGSRYSK